MVVPSSCNECNSILAHSHAVTFLCDCCVAVCMHCILHKLSVSDATYKSFLVCPECNKLPSNAFLRSKQQACKLSIKSAESYEVELLAEAFKRINIKDFKAIKFKEKVTTLQQSSTNLRYVQSQLVKYSSTLTLVDTYK